MDHREYPWPHPARGAERLSFNAIYDQSDRLGVAGVQLAAFPNGQPCCALPRVPGRALHDLDAQPGEVSEGLRGA